MSTVQEVMYNHAIRYFHHQIITVVPHNLSLSNMFCLETRKSSWPAQGERKWRGGRGLLPPWDGRKIEFSSPSVLLWPAVPVYLVHSAVTRGVPKPPVFCIVIGVGRI